MPDNNNPNPLPSTVNETLRAPSAQLFVGRYETRRVLGRGAMGEVLEVHDRHSGSDYALKRVPPELVRDAMQMASIRANFVLVSQLSHPHIGSTRQLEIDSVTGHALIIMDLIRGDDLSRWLVGKRAQLGAANSPLSLQLALGIAEQVASALDYAHSQPASRGPDGKPTHFGILHRDLKPANIMVEDGREYRPGVPYVKLIDFGLAAEIQASLQSMSVAGEKPPCGTPVYMAPEQWEGRTLTRGVDQWALAVMIYEMVAGRRPFDGPSETAVMHQIEKADPEPPPTLTPVQWATLKKTFQRDRKARHASCMALVKALAASDPSMSTLIVANEIPMPEESGGISAQATAVKPPPPAIATAPAASATPTPAAKPGMNPKLLAAAFGIILVSLIIAFKTMNEQGQKDTAIITSGPYAPEPSTPPPPANDNKEMLAELEKTKNALAELKAEQERQQQLAQELARQAAEVKAQAQVKAAEQDSKLEERFVCTAGRFSIRPPKGWSMIDITALKNKVARGPAENGFAPNINFIDEAYNSTLDNYVAANVSNVTMMFPGLTKYKQDEVKLDSGERAIRLVVGYQMYGRSLRQTFYFTRGSAGKMFTITCSALSAGGEALDSVFERSVKTFKNE